MNTKLLIIFIVLNILNVILQTVKSICTIKCGKGMASLVNATAYGLYTVVIIYTVCDLPLWLKALVVALANLVGVYVVKWLEEKSRKDKLWKVEMTAYNRAIEEVLKSANLSYSVVETSTQTYIFNVYCPTQKESLAVKQIANDYNVKYFVSESKTLQNGAEQVFGFSARAANKKTLDFSFGMQYNKYKGKGRFETMYAYEIRVFGQNFDDVENEGGWQLACKCYDYPLILKALDYWYDLIGFEKIETNFKIPIDRYN